MTSAKSIRFCKSIFALAAFASSFFPRPAAAADPPPFSAPKSAPPAAAASPLLGPVERLPAEAYPAPTTRGLYGGSLWLVPDLHGEQWPYYRKTGIGISGSVFVDFSYERNLQGEPLHGVGGIPGSNDTTNYLENGRFVLRATPTWSDRKYFVQGQAELVATQLSTSTSGVVWSADDMWIKAGMWKIFDVQVGRFQAWEVYHHGMGLDLYTTEFAGATGPFGIANIYGLDYMLYRQDTVGQAAVHVYPLDWLRFEVEGLYGSAGGTNTLGVRPVGIADFGWLKLKAGAEIRDAKGAIDNPKDELRQEGVGGSVAFVFDPTIEFGVSGAYGQTDQRDTAGVIKTTGTFNTYSIGGFANVRIVDRVLLGGGLHYTFKEDTDVDTTLNRDETFDQWQGFGALQYLLFDQLFIKGVFSYAIADNNPIPMSSPVYKNQMYSFRLRFQYLF
ncbi:MAG TPA: hypothetical protein VGM06_19790 [Polyangiaceae bacterium]|jgi:hypothetical protein